jgi:glucose/mannose-6-phosphate isomerase
MKYNKLIFCGIGGSAYPGEVVKAIGMKHPVIISREDFPRHADEKSLVFVISYSGNTAETIKLYRAAKRRKCQIIVITSGGKLSKVDERIFMVEGGKMPREAFMHMLVPVLDFLDIDYGKKIVNRDNKKEARSIARKLKGKVPVIYGSGEEFKFLSYRWQTFFQENAKVFAHSNYFPELAHNEIEDRVNKKYRVVLLYDKKTRQIKISMEYFKKPIEVKLKGKRLVDKIIYGTNLGFWVTYYLAGMLHRDYKRIARIEGMKKRLKRS